MVKSVLVIIFIFIFVGMLFLVLIIGILNYFVIFDKILFDFEEVMFVFLILMLV